MEEWTTEMENFGEYNNDLSDYNTSDAEELWGKDFEDENSLDFEDVKNKIENLQEFEEKSAALEAADYARSLGFEKAGDYIERHYDGNDYVPGEPIRITTRNMSLDGDTSANGIEFERRDAELAKGLVVNGVFPEFDSKHHIELGTTANDMSIYQQFSACREDFQDHMYDNPEKLESITFGDMERMDKLQGYTPEGWVFQHNPETGSFDLVNKEDHRVGHTGGNALWGK